MLTELFVSNLAVVDRVTARFGPGLNVVTGETGAGKSLIIGSLGLALGGRASAELVRQGASEAEVTARFELPSTLSIDEAEDGVLILRRVIAADGRSRAYINDRPVTVGALKVIGARLADLHGQHEQQNLLDPAAHLEYLDAFVESAPLVEAVRSAHATLRTAQSARQRALDNARADAEEQEFLRFQLRELDDAELVIGEQAQLESEHQVAAHAGRLAEWVGESLGELSDESPSAESLLAAAARRLQQAADLDPSLQSPRRAVDEALVAVEEAARELSRYQERLESDPARLEFVVTRLEQLKQLRRKHRLADEAALLAHRDALRERVGDDAGGEQRMAELEAQVARAEAALLRTLTPLSAARNTGAVKLSREVSRELARLGMKDARFTVELSPPEQGLILSGRPHPVAETGAEIAVFNLAANPGEPGGALSRVASGGELSRIMLAVKTVLRRADPVPLAVFDEVDAGIGGLVAEAVGKRLAGLGAERQVLVVTHLAVIAGRASHHLRVSKSTTAKRTRVEIEVLAGTEREEELARMLAGRAGGDDARRTARALMEESTGG